jgi:hypothetical protein
LFIHFSTASPTAALGQMGWSNAYGQTITFSQLADVADEWGIAYGLFFTAPKLRKDDCDNELGCGGFDGAPVALITLPNALLPFNTHNAPK